ncbi:MAG: porin [Planctomycetes bacterium]|nr:porin [Planctomycetota bacterium]
MNRAVLNAAFACGVLGALAGSSLATGAEALPSQADMWRIIQEQNRQIEALTRNQKATDERLEATGDAVEEVRRGDSGGASSGTKIGGYGELHYNGGKESGDDELDFHRFVLFVDHEFTDSIRFYSELELEHALAGEGQPGEVELEQAYLEFDLNRNNQIKTGLFLVPVGILNETHEPPTFFGVERNPVEKNIIPTTWWEGGVSFVHRHDSGFTTELALHSGLNTPSTGADAFLIRKGRQKVAQADADNLAATARVKYTGIPGVEVAASAQYQQDMTQSNFAEEISATLFEVHADVRKGPWGLRALFAQWDLDGAAPAAVGRDRQVGWYVEPAYYCESAFGEFGFFARYNVYDNNAGNSTDTESAQVDVGVNFWPHENVVLKADLQVNRDPGAMPADDKIANFGIGLMF